MALHHKGRMLSESGCQQLRKLNEVGYLAEVLCKLYDGWKSQPVLYIKMTSADDESQALNSLLLYAFLNQK